MMDRENLRDTTSPCDNLAVPLPNVNRNDDDRLFERNIKRLEMLPGGKFILDSGCSRSEILKLFDSLDTKLDGQLDADELRAAFAILGSTISRTKLKAWICCITQDKSHMLDPGEFLGAVTAHMMGKCPSDWPPLELLYSKRGREALMQGSTWARQSQRSEIEDEGSAKSIHQVSRSACLHDGKPEDGRQKARRHVSAIMKRLSRRQLIGQSSPSSSTQVVPFGGQPTEAAEVQNTPSRQAAW